ncbi:MAG: 50S ribosomal protein L40e [Candidatus Aenigmarchaeota archaeon]|nr:50S ribosomal protein L40e [Candidatus Aenigmarchaeota archaeon]
MPKTRVEAVTKRIYSRVFVCMKCNAKIRADARKVKIGKVKCRKCYSKQLRPKSKERKI